MSQGVGGLAPQESVEELVRAATARLREAGVPSPGVDALLLAAHVLGTEVGEVQKAMILRASPPPEFAARFAAVVSERAARVPVQHLTGRAAFRGLTLHVGPGAFVPRPETEGVAQLAIDAALACGESPLVVDLCTGTGALALAVAVEVPQATVIAVESSDLAVAWARRNVEDLAPQVDLVHADATKVPAELRDVEGRCDVVVSNPPYIPVGMVPVDPEVRDHDPQMALFGGSEDGLAIPLAVAATAARLLRPGGVLVMEHADEQGESLPASLTRTGHWTEVIDHVDLTGRARTTTARRMA